MDGMKRYRFEPDWRNIEAAARNRWAPRLPLYEHLVGSKVIYELTGARPFDGMGSADAGERNQAFRDFWRFFREMGYDTASFECCISPILPGGGALGAHRPGAIHSREDFERYPWAELPDRYFQAFAPQFRALAETCPPGMKAIGGVGNGVFECVQDLVSYIDLCYIRGEDEDLYRDLFRTMGDVQAAIWERFLREFADVYCVLRFGDDLGFNTATLISPGDIRECVVPQYRRIVDMVHAAGKPFLLHSCGNLFRAFDDLIDGAGIDAKHSNEDSIAHFSVWVDRYGERIGNFGGIDTDVLVRQTPEAIRDYVWDCLARVRGKGGIAFGSGNSIPDYVPSTGYLAMVEAVRDWRGDEQM